MAHGKDLRGSVQQRSTQCAFPDPGSEPADGYPTRLEIGWISVARDPELGPTAQASSLPRVRDVSGLFLIGAFFLGALNPIFLPLGFSFSLLPSPWIQVRKLNSQHAPQRKVHPTEIASAWRHVFRSRRINNLFHYSTKYLVFSYHRPTHAQCRLGGSSAQKSEIGCEP